MGEHILKLEELLEGAKHVGPNSRFWYRCKYDPIPKENSSETTKKE